MLASVLCFVAVFFIEHKEPQAFHQFKDAMLATVIVLGIFGVWHLVRTPWLVHKRTLAGESHQKWTFGMIGVGVAVLFVGGIAGGTILISRAITGMRTQTASLPSTSVSNAVQEQSHSSQSATLTPAFIPPDPKEQQASIREENRLAKEYDRVHPGKLDLNDRTNWVNEQLEKEGSSLRIRYSRISSNKLNRPCPNGYAEIGEFHTDHVTNAVTIHNNPCIKVHSLNVKNGENGVLIDNQSSPASPQSTPPK